MQDRPERGTAALADALARGDAAAAAALYAADGTLLVAAAEPINGRPQIEAYWQAGIAFGLTSLELRAIELRVESGVAIEIGRYTLALDVDGRGHVVEAGNYLVLHRRLPDGPWRRTVDVFNPDVPQEARRKRKEDER
jgi:ketosteroid isomerase-like protein